MYINNTPYREVLRMALFTIWSKCGKLRAWHVLTIAHQYANTSVRTSPYKMSSSITHPWTGNPRSRKRILNKHSGEIAWQLDILARTLSTDRYTLGTGRGYDEHTRHWWRFSSSIAVHPLICLWWPQLVLAQKPWERSAAIFTSSLHNLLPLLTAF